MKWRNLAGPGLLGPTCFRIPFGGIFPRPGRALGLQDTSPRMKQMVLKKQSPALLPRLPPRPRCPSPTQPWPRCFLSLHSGSPSPAQPSLAASPSAGSSHWADFSLLCLIHASFPPTLGLLAEPPESQFWLDTRGLSLQTAL